MKVSNYTPKSHPILKPISFTVHVNGRQLTASIVEILDHPVHNKFVVKFSDNHIDSFELTEEGNVVPDNVSSGRSYSDAIKLDLQALGLLTPDELVWTLRHVIDGQEVNVWIIRKKRDAGTIFTVNYNGEYHFHIKQDDDNWVSESFQIDPEPINENLAEEVIAFIQKEYLTIPFFMV